MKYQNKFMSNREITSTLMFIVVAFLNSKRDSCVEDDLDTYDVGLHREDITEISNLVGKYILNEGNFHREDVIVERIANRGSIFNPSSKLIKNVSDFFKAALVTICSDSPSNRKMLKVLANVQLGERSALPEVCLNLNTPTQLERLMAYQMKLRIKDTTYIGRRLTALYEDTNAILDLARPTEWIEVKEHGVIVKNDFNLPVVAAFYITALLTVRVLPLFDRSYRTTDWRRCVFNSVR